MRARKPYILPPSLELEKIISLREAEQISGESEDTIKRHRPEVIIRLSRRRLGIRVKHALRLAEPTA